MAFLNITSIGTHYVTKQRTCNIMPVWHDVYSGIQKYFPVHQNVTYGAVTMQRGITRETTHLTSQMKSLGLITITFGNT